MSLLGRIRDLLLKRAITEQNQFYQRSLSPGAIRDWQLRKWNEIWKSISQDVPYFESLKKKGVVPNVFSSWDEFKERIPLMTRATIQTKQGLLVSPLRKKKIILTTGGSTAEPIQIPAWKSEKKVCVRNMWYARNWFKVSPSDRLFLIWGHSHLLGRGSLANFRGQIRSLKDKALGYYRFSAYDLSKESLEQAARVLLDFGPAYILAYSVALDRFARVNREYKKNFHDLRMKVAIATAESFPSPDSADFISDVLGCPVVMEYGSVETGPIAYQSLDGQYSIFWKDFFLEGEESKCFPGKYEIFLTSLYPRCLPLVRYQIGDLVDSDLNAGNFMQRFRSLSGRCNDYIALPDGSVVHSEGFSHVLKIFPSILGYQVIQDKRGEIALSYLSDIPLSDSVIDEIRSRFGRIHPRLVHIKIARSNSLAQTIAGKTRRIIRDFQLQNSEETVLS